MKLNQIDQSEFSKRFRNRELPVKRNGPWAIIPQNVSSDLSKFTQEELDIKLNFSQQPTEAS